jgi:hypothetical protein
LEQVVLLLLYAGRKCALTEHDILSVCRVVNKRHNLDLPLGDTEQQFTQVLRRMSVARWLDPRVSLRLTEHGVQETESAVQRKTAFCRAIQVTAAQINPKFQEV